MNKWTKEWPKKEGHYWFYGWTSNNSKKTLSRKLHLVEVHKITNGLCYIARGQFLYKSEGAEGIWQEAELPELPEEL